jgi:hypothetical protein
VLSQLYESHYEQYRQDPQGARQVLTLGESSPAEGPTRLPLLFGRLARYSIQPRESTTFLAGSGGVPGGREMGRWIDRHIPQGARILTVGPSMANIVQFYGRRKSYGLAVSPNPLHRNPAYEPLPNPDLLIRHNDLQYVVWAAFSAARSPFFSKRILRYADRFNGRLIHSETIQVKTPSGRTARKPLISLYEVRP